MTESARAQTASANQAAEVVLKIDDLKTYFYTREGTVRAVDGVSWELYRGETLGVVGESGCGKSVTALSILRLVADPPGRIAGGAITYGGQDLLKLSEQRMQQIRGNDISMIFQEPMTSLNPVLTIGNQIAETIMLHEGLTKKDAWDKSIQMLRLVHIPEPVRRVQEYPHQLSGGMRQRVMIAMALSCNPQILIADEPTTALDVTIQAQILDLMLELKQETGSAVIIITHNLGVVAETCRRVVVMYAGKKVEEGSAEEIFHHPRHPYTYGLLGSVPRLDKIIQEDSNGRSRLTEIPGIVPSLRNLPPGCTFAPRCTYATDACREKYPPLEQKLPGHWAACWNSDKLPGGR